MTFPLVTAVSAQPWLDQVPCSQPLEETDNQKQWTQEDTYSFGPLGGLSKPNPSHLEFVLFQPQAEVMANLEAWDQNWKGCMGLAFQAPHFLRGNTEA